MNEAKKLLFIGVTITLCVACRTKSTQVPSFIPGNYTDDYNIEYTISDESFLMKPNTLFNIIEWNIEEQYFIAQNDSSNKFDGGLYSRIDWMFFENMEPYNWGFCLSSYKAPSPDSAKNVTSADRSQAITGCNGFPFSRMKLADR